MSDFDFDPPRDIAPLRNTNNFIPQKEYLNPQEYAVVQSAREKTLYPAMERTLKLQDAQRKRQIQDLAYKEAMLTMDQKRRAYEEQQQADAKLGGISDALYAAQSIEDPNERTKRIADIHIQEAEALTKGSYGQALVAASTFSLNPDFRAKEREQAAAASKEQQLSSARNRAAAYNIYENVSWIQEMPEGSQKSLYQGMAKSNQLRYQLEQDQLRKASQLKGIEQDRGFFSDVIQSRRDELQDLVKQYNSNAEVVTRGAAVSKIATELAGPEGDALDFRPAAEEEYDRRQRLLFQPLEVLRTPYGEYPTGIKEDTSPDEAITLIRKALMKMESDMVAGNFTRPEQKVLAGTQAAVPPSLPVSELVESSTKAKKNVEARGLTPQGPTKEDLSVLEEITKAANN
jgi:hypothetical protein